ncbi:Predicted O-methyltransferase YrrM [Thermostaphylospora chromogena]|uniref:Predicted O-methyltransferase YrrM n=2 Tax=Thermostaphylospora chromogena TaxID=35622 RepID=A0A1H1D5A6_9ACTN|nr:Predicted O-methyltransferase YrrM [Thermostaphylospora chromogena]
MALPLFGIVGWPVALQLALSAATLAALAAAVVSIRRTDGKALRTEQRVKRQEAKLAAVSSDLSALVPRLAAQVESAADGIRAEVRDVVATLGEDRAELTVHTRTLQEHSATLREHSSRLQEQSARLAELSKAVSRIEKVLGEKVLPEVRARGDFSQVEAMIDLRALLEPRAPLPRLRNWAASPDVLRLLIEHIATTRPKLIVECGSGSSSVWLGYAVEKYGAGRVVALEHDERFVRTSRDLVAAHGLESVVEVRHAPLVEWRSFPWYDTAALADLTDIELVFVDGPPQSVGPLARYPAVPLLLPHCAPSVLFVLDDAKREDEREIADRWVREFPELTRSVFPAEKGAMLFRRSAP